MSRRCADGLRGAPVSGPARTDRFETDVPPPGAGRPSLVHVTVLAPGRRTQTTQCSPRAGQAEIAHALVLVKE